MKIATKPKEWWEGEFVPDLIVVNSSIQGGEPTIKGTRVPTEVASFAWTRGMWEACGLTREQSLAGLCFEAGREYEKQKGHLRKFIREFGDKYNKTHYPEREVDND